ncbi:response regulator [Motiliproteus sp. MSK22-1]|uniref:response regulator n=1 Tax=Motiliproteus sp. MSK22-1 TaxID=1897630 RepID=UPI001E635F32|nr:response regulator [Motiliproteus sp. MSK22-1]
MSVLICDDSNMARKQMKKSLPDEWDVEVSFANDGAEAMEVIRSGGVDLMFLDLTMPVMDGFEVLEMIKKEGHKTLVLVVSADIQPQAVERVKKMHALEFVQKPVDKEKVTNVLRQYGLL